MGHLVVWHLVSAYLDMIIWLHIQRLAMLGLLVLSCLRVARDVSRAHLSRGSALSRALRVRGVELGPIVRRGGVGGRFGCVASSLARSSVAAGWAAGEEGTDVRSMTLSV